MIQVARTAAPRDLGAQPDFVPAVGRTVEVGISFVLPK